MADFVRPPGLVVEDRIEIAASPEAVWAVLAAVNGWSRWNPLYAQAEGALIVGERIDLTIVLDGMKPQRASPMVQAVEPAALLQYQTSNLGGLIRATRYVVLTPLAGLGTAVLNGEAMGGPIGRLLARPIGAKVQAGLAAMNLALKNLSENQS